jgi:hypothetical protein
MISEVDATSLNFFFFFSCEHVKKIYIYKSTFTRCRFTQSLHLNCIDKASKNMFKIVFEK